MRLLLLPAIFCLNSILGCTTNLSSKQVDAGVLVSEFIYDEAPFPQCHASTIVKTDKGLLASWFGGTYERHPDVSIYISECLNGIWSSPTLVADGVINDTLRYPCWNPVLFKRENNDLVLYYKVGPSPSEWWGLYKISTDNGKTWSESIHIPDQLLGPIKNKPCRLPNGSILYPTSYETEKEWGIYTETSDRELKDWNKTPIDNNGFNAIQPTILFHDSGMIQMLCRSKEKKIVETWSSDLGKTWTPVEATSLPNNNSGIDAITLHNGLFLLVCNPLEQGRNKLSVLVSSDGKSWKDLIVLEDHAEGEFSYPAIIEDEGKVHITYTYNRIKIRYVLLEIREK